MLLAVPLIHPGSRTTTRSGPPSSGTTLSILFLTGIEWSRLVRSAACPPVRTLAMSLYAASVRWTGSPSIHMLSPAELCLSASLPRLLKASTGLKVKIEKPAFAPSTHTHHHPTGFNSRMEEVLEVHVYQMPGIHAAWLQNIAEYCGSTQTRMASPAASISGQMLMNRLRRTASGANSRQPRRWKQQGLVWKAAYQTHLSPYIDST